MKNSLVLGICLVVSSSIIGYAIIQTNSTNFSHSINAVHGFNMSENPFKVNVDQIERIDRFNLSTPTTFKVLTTNNEPVEIQAKSSSLAYFHDSKVLRINYKSPEGKESTKFFNNPISWQIEKE